MSHNGGAEWEPLGSGMPVVSVADIKVFHDDNHHHVVAGTHGRSMYKLDVSIAPTLQDLATPQYQTVSFEAPYPNPFKTSVRLEYEVDAPVHITVEILDALGRRVSVVADRAQGAGRHAITWAPQRLVPGVYFIRVLANGRLQSVRPVTRF